jgi:gluconolactonase
MRTPVLFAEKLSAPEGPVVGPNGWILNVCSFTLEKRGWATKGGDITATHQSRPTVSHTVFNTSTDEVVGIPAALAFGPDGCLYVTDEGRRSIVRVTPDGKQSDFISNFEGDRLNGPNDLCFDDDGNLFFTDPWGSSLDNKIGAVYGYEWPSGPIHRIHTGLAFPNGILVRDGRLYVAETQTNMIWIYELSGAGNAQNPAVFAKLPDLKIPFPVGPDGMAFDGEGNIFIAEYGAGLVFLYDPAGYLRESIPIGGARPTNVCFGGRGHDTLYVTIDDLGSLVAVPAGVSGYRLPFCPSRSKDHPWSNMLPPDLVST